MTAASGTDGCASFANGDFGRELSLTYRKVIFSAATYVQKNALARAIRSFARSIGGDRDSVADDTV
jgi:hypothetical protein